MATGPLDTFDHVVVLMLENRSLDNTLGYLYETGLPSGKTFDGIANINFSNPDMNGTPVPVSPCTDFHQPYPDPGEEFDHITFQLFSSTQASGTPKMQGFIKDYYATLQATAKWKGSPAQQSPVIMQCFQPAKIPVLSALATQFGVFDHWYCAVPSQTWCNRAFWHAATSWGWVNNPPAFQSSNPWNLDHWAHSSATPTLFDLLEQKFGAGSWHVYEDLAVALTKLVHWGDLKDKIGETYFRYLEGGEPFFTNFFDDCKNGDLPKYSFLEPHFINFLDDVIWHDDMHPSSFDSVIYSDGGPGSVLLGDRLVWKIYQAIRNSNSASGNNWQNTLFIITFDEHGGCIDHVPPPPATAPDPKQFNTGKGEDSFDFKRLGVRVPTVMVSAYIAANTIVNSPMHHCSFLQTMEQKWGLPSLGPRDATAPPFTEVFAASQRALSTWPDFPFYPGPASTVDATQIRSLDLSAVPVNGLQASILNAILELYGSDPALAGLALASGQQVTNAQEAKTLLDRMKVLRFPAR
jgi:phospholipase C